MKPILATGLVIFSFAVWMTFEIPRGILVNTDELLTAERTREMLLTNPWSVHFNFEISFAKPPLQYWLTTLTLPRIQNRTLAVRVWPLFYGLLTLVAIAWLAMIVDPARRWLAPLSVTVLASCPLFSTEACRALLDTGLTFFATVAIVCAQLARRKPVWWSGVAVACWLGTLQKIPLIFLLWLLILLLRLFSPNERRTLRSGWLPLSILLALVLISAWPLLQMARYHMPLSRLFGSQEVMHLLGPARLGARPYFEIPFRLSIGGWISGSAALIAAIAIVSLKKFRSRPMISEIAFVCLLLIALAILFNFRSVRYVMPIVPSLCLVLALALHWLLEQRKNIRAFAILLTIVLLSAGFVQAKIQIDRRMRDVSDEKRVAEELGARQREDARIVLIKAPIGGSDLLYDSFYLFHGNLKFPTTKLTVDQLQQSPPAPPIVGVCVQRDFPVVQKVYPNVQIDFLRAQFILWEANK